MRDRSAPVGTQDPFGGARFLRSRRRRSRHAARSSATSAASSSGLLPDGRDRAFVRFSVREDRRCHYTKPFTGLFIAMLTLTPFAPIAAERAADAGPAARVGDHVFTLDDVDRVAMVQDSGRFRGLRLRDAIYEARKNAVETLIADRLIRADAAAADLSAAALVDREVTRTAVAVTDRDVDDCTRRTTPASAAPHSSRSRRRFVRRSNSSAATRPGRDMLPGFAPRRTSLPARRRPAKRSPSPERAVGGPEPMRRFKSSCTRTFSALSARGSVQRSRRFRRPTATVCGSYSATSP